MTVRIETVNMQEVQAAIRAYGERAVAEIGKAVQAHAINVRTGIQRKIQRGPASGVTYTRGNVSHTASAPGEAPATDTGTLASSIAYRKAGPLTAEIESRLDYAAFLEFGTRKMAARPSWVPTVEETRPDFVRRVTDAIARAAR